MSVTRIDKDLISQRQAVLDGIKIQLKKDFVGIDPIIDNLLDYIRIWYLMPEILSRPIVVCLWGMTGVGKTDLVRKLVRYLHFQDRFVEVELGNSDETVWYNSVYSVLNTHGITDGKPAVVLFDEIQRFNTLDSDGQPVPNTKFSDFWELLSDGRLARRERDDLDSIMNQYLLNQRQRKRDLSRPQPEGAPPLEDPMQQEIGLWEAQQLKKMLSLEDDVVELAETPRVKMLERILEAKQNKRFYEPVDYSKTLILISGNLDEAFQMANQTAESDVDADIFHAFTKKITIVDIKNALTSRFRPEQVARFGNIHLIYTSLRRANFETLIEMEIGKLVARTHERFGLELGITENVMKLIYRNGVFPVQGVRPVFSSIVDILETNLSKLVFEAVMNEHTRIDIDYDAEKQDIVARFNQGSDLRIPYIGRIDKIRQSNLQDVVSNVSVHEAGHAVVYVAEFGLAPLQLKSKVASSYAGGFTFPHQIYETKDNLLKKARVYLAGGLAEELIFGAKNATVGRAHDREMTTIIVAEYIRRYGFESHFQATYTLEFAYAMDKFKTDSDVEKMVAQLAAETYAILDKHRNFLLGLSKKLQETGSLEAREVAAVAADFDMTAQIKEEGYLHLPAYTELLDNPDLLGNPAPFDDDPEA
jgi:Peptidase family M41/C-terminal, D2-small domain, of ClpB protein/ATPase family associated with various cellular activities (AAA)